MAITNINSAWKTDLYPLIDRVFDVECKNRLAALRTVVSEEDTRNATFRMEGLGGFGELPAYNGTLENLDQRRGFITTITPQEHAGSIDIDYKYAKVDKSGVARRIGRLAAHTASMQVYTGVLRMFGSAFDSSVTGADGCPWASESHPVASKPRAYPPPTRPPAPTQTSLPTSCPSPRSPPRTRWPTAS